MPAKINTFYPSFLPRAIHLCPVYASSLHCFKNLHYSYSWLHDIRKIQKSNKMIIISPLTSPCVITLATHCAKNFIILENNAKILQIMILWHHEYFIAMLNLIKCVVECINVTGFAKRGLPHTSNSMNLHPIP